MARGGYIALAIAIDRVFLVSRSRSEAAQAIAESLISGTILARGQPVTYTQAEADLRERKLVDLGAYSPERSYGAVTDIPKSFWACAEDIASWDGTYDSFTDLSKEDPLRFANINVREKDVNSLIKRHQPELQAANQQSRERLRQASWDQWVAAVACLAHERQIDAYMTQTDFLARVTARLATWNLDEMPTSTVAPAARAILGRYRSDPPTDPLIL